MDPVLTAAQNKIELTINHLQQELGAIRAGRANPSLIENVLIPVYGTHMKLVELGTIGAPQNTLLTIQVWDPSILKDVQKGIMEANLGLTPSIEGQIIRLPLPPLTEERRQEFIKLSAQKGEIAKVSVRQVRSDQRAEWEKAETAGDIGEDELDRREKFLQILIDQSMARVDEMVKAKEEVLREI